MFLRIYLLQANGIEANRHNWYQKLLMSKKIRLLLYALVESCITNPSRKK